MLRKRPPSQRQHPASLRTILPTQNNNQHNIVQARRKLKPRSSLLKRFQRNTIILSSAVVASVCLYKVSTSITSLAASAKFLSSHKNHKPVTIGCYFDGKSQRSRITRIRRLPTYDEDKYPSKRQMPWTIEEEESQQKLRDSKRYRGITPAGATNETCELRYEWQKQYHPNCNPVHENDFTKFFAESNTGVDENIRLVASGYFRDVWKVPDSASDSASASASARDGDDDSKERQRQWVASKTLRYKHAYTNRNFDRHRRDALTTERTTASPYTVDIYAHCVHTMVSEFSEEGSLSDLIWPRGELEGGESSSTCKLSMRERLGFALEAARGLAAVHFADGPQDPSTAHTDITPSQFLLVDGSLKLNDFNRARFIPYKSNGTAACPFRVSMNPGKYRSPEEYDNGDETEKIDVYSLGNVLYSLLTESWPFQNLTEKEAQEKVLNGERPSIDMTNTRTTDPFALVLINAINMSWTHEASERPSSKDLVQYLGKEVDRLNTT